MDKHNVITYFGGVPKTAKAMGLTPAAVYAWPEKLVFAVACQVEVRSGRNLRVDIRDYEKQSA